MGLSARPVMVVVVSGAREEEDEEQRAKQRGANPVARARGRALRADERVANGAAARPAPPLVSIRRLLFGHAHGMHAGTTNSVVSSTTLLLLLALPPSIHPSIHPPMSSELGHCA